jgi:hypothetical protein
VEDRPGAIATSGGSIERAKKDWQVRPTGPVGVIAATIATPLAKWPSTARYLGASIVITPRDISFITRQYSTMQ